MISWTPGPPPVEWRDGRDVACCTGGGYRFLQWINGAWDDGDYFLCFNDEITHHAAVNAPDLAIVSEMG